MTNAISAVFHSCKHIPTRKAFQIILEIAEERAAEAFAVLGSPSQDGGTWVAVAKLNYQPEKQVIP